MRYSVIESVLILMWFADRGRVVEEKGICHN
jgi:hypothetical protein